MKNEQLDTKNSTAKENSFSKPSFIGSMLVYWECTVEKFLLKMITWCLSGWFWQSHSLTLRTSLHPKVAIAVCGACGNFFHQEGTCVDLKGLCALFFAMQNLHRVLLRRPWRNNGRYYY